MLTKANLILVIRRLPGLAGAMLIFAVTIATLHLLCASFTTLPEDPGGWKALAHVRGLRREIRNERAAQRMQAVFPEGACFTLTLHGLSWARIASTGLLDERERAEALEQIEWTLLELNRPYVLERFSDTQVRNGVFWLGQRNLLLGRYLKLLHPLERPAGLVAEFHADSLHLAEEFLESPTGHLDSYPGLCWPADNVTALVSLVLHDELFGTDLREAYEAWKRWTISHPDPVTGLPAGHLYSNDGRLRQPARGCAMSWIIPLLSEIDRDHAGILYRQYRRTMGIKRLGFSMFREYPIGTRLSADVDSGPIIRGAGVVATGVGLAASLAVDDMQTADDIHALAGMLGLKSESGHEGHTEIRHLFGRLPVGDAFLAWGYALGMSKVGAGHPPNGSRWFKSGELWAMALVTTSLSIAVIIRIRKPRETTCAKPIRKHPA